MDHSMDGTSIALVVSVIIGTINVGTEMFIAVVRERPRDLPTETTRPWITLSTLSMDGSFRALSSLCRF